MSTHEGFAKGNFTGNEMSQSQTSFNSIDPQQQEKLKKLTKPFAISNKRTNFLKEQEIDDMISEISTPDIDYSERKKILEALEKREKFKEEIELDNCLKTLTGKALDLGLDKDEIESISSKSFSEMKIKQQ